MPPTKSASLKNYKGKRHGKLRCAPVEKSVGETLDRLGGTEQSWFSHSPSAPARSQLHIIRVGTTFHESIPLGQGLLRSASRRRQEPPCRSACLSIQMAAYFVSLLE